MYNFIRIILSINKMLLISNKWLVLAMSSSTVLCMGVFLQLGGCSKAGSGLVVARRFGDNLYYNSPYGLCHSPHLTSVALICGLYKPSSGPIALRNVLKCTIQYH